MRGVRTVVGIGTALRLNPCLREAVEKRFHVRCLIPEVKEMAAWGAALYVLDRDKARPRCRNTAAAGIASKKTCAR